MRILLYCQHVLGMGHLFRSLELARAMHEHQVLLVTGGPWVELELPGHIRREQMPPLRMDADFAALLPGEELQGQDLESIKERRRKRLQDLLHEFVPHVFVVELYPFGRRAFDFELLPALRLAGEIGCRRVCSLRDILVEKKDQGKYEARVLARLNPHFDLLLVHSDPDVCSLERTFSRLADVKPAVACTGYVAPDFPQQARQQAQDLRQELAIPADEKLLVASAGSGSVGFELLRAGIEASALLFAHLPHRLCVFSGPLMEEGEFQELERLARPLPFVRLRRCSRRLNTFLAAADLSLSMGGYNTVMALVAAQTFGLVLPFAQNREQRMRAELLQQRGLLRLLAPRELQPETLQSVIASELAIPREPGAKVDVRGARNTVRCLERLQAPTQNRGAVSSEVRQPWSVTSQSNITHISQVLLEQLHDKLQGRSIPVFFRADDVAVPGDKLERLLGLFLRHETPLWAAVVPAWLQEGHWRRLHQLTRGSSLFIWHQHGWRHANHEVCGKKCEFGPARSMAGKRADLSKGRDKLTRLLGPAFTPWFTPPWNRMDADSLGLLPGLGYAGLSADAKLCGNAVSRGIPLAVKAVQLDLHTRKESGQGQALAGMLHEIDQGIAAGGLGVMLHHQRMNPTAFAFLDALLRQLPRTGLLI